MCIALSLTEGEEVGAVQVVGREEEELSRRGEGPRPKQGNFSMEPRRQGETTTSSLIGS